jgi:hypothetical protein
LYSLPNINRTIKWRRLRWAVHVALMGRGEEKCIWVVGGKASEKEATGKTGT